jgi:predicted dehydrogenase
MDRYRNFLKGSWKESAAPGSGLVYDLGPHLIDQALHSFGRPAKVTGFLQNLRGIGNEAVEDNVSVFAQLHSNSAYFDLFKFTVILHYDRTQSNPYLLTAILRCHPMSQRTPQLRYTVRGSKGTFVKYGLDVQEEQIKAKGMEAFDKDSFGREPEEFQAELEVVEKEGDNAPLKSKYAPSIFAILGSNHHEIDSCQNEVHTKNSTKISLLLFERMRHWLFSGTRLLWSCSSLTWRSEARRKDVHWTCHQSRLGEGSKFERNKCPIL